MGFLERIYLKTGYNRQLIKKIAAGQKYLAVHFLNGQIGVCATLGNEIPKDFRPPLSLDLKNPVHRILFIAYTNASMNYLQTEIGENDIFDQVNFSFYSKIVMVGLFQSLLDKFDQAKLKVHVFDIEKTGSGLTHMQYQKKFLNEADAVILTSTSLVNNTFDEVIAETNPESHVYMLGPSGILSGEYFRYPQVKMVFGSLFEKNDTRVLEVIEKGYGTRLFLPYLRKVFMERNEDETA